MEDGIEYLGEGLYFVEAGEQKESEDTVNGWATSGKQRIKWLIENKQVIVVSMTRSVDNTGYYVVTSAKGMSQETKERMAKLGYNMSRF